MVHKTALRLSGRGPSLASAEAPLTARLLARMAHVAPLQMLQEEAEDEGREVPEPPVEARSWCAAAAGRPLLPPSLPLPWPHLPQRTLRQPTLLASATLTDRNEEQIRAYFKSGGAELPPANGCGAANGSTLADLAARFPPPDADTFRKWFPGLALSKTACDKPRCAGCAVPYGSCIRWHMLPCCVRFAPPYNMQRIRMFLCTRKWLPS